MIGLVGASGGLVRASRARDSVKASASRIGADLLRGKGVAQVGVREHTRVVDPVGSARIVLLVERAVLGFLIQIGGEILTGQDTLEIIGEQHPLGAGAARVE